MIETPVRKQKLPPTQTPPPLPSQDQSDTTEPKGVRPSATDSASHELGEALASLDAPFFPEYSGAVILEEENPVTLTWQDILGPDFKTSDQQMLIKILARLSEQVTELQPFQGNALGAITQLGSVNPEYLALVVLEEYTDPRSLPTIARFLALYHWTQTGELRPKEDFMNHAKALFDEETHSLRLPAAPDQALPDTIRDVLEGQTSPQVEQSPTSEKDQRIGQLLELFRKFYEAVEANNFQESWPVDAGRLAIVFGKLNTNFIEKVIKNGIVAPIINNRGRYALNERDALMLLHYRSDNMERLGVRLAGKKLGTLMRHYWEARSQFASEYRERTGKELPHPGLEP